MRQQIVCSMVDDCTVVVKRKDEFIAIAMQPPYVYVINLTAEGVEKPLVTYVARGGDTLFYKILGTVCMNDDCESLFSNDAECHLKNGYRLDEAEAAKVEEFVTHTYQTCVNAAARDMIAAFPPMAVKKFKDALEEHLPEEEQPVIQILM